MAYDVPGRADNLPLKLVDAWNQTIADTFGRQPERNSRFFVLDFAALDDPQPADVHWPGDPAEPLSCTNDAATAQGLCDWGVRGRHVFHNEYCEYTVISADDNSGKPRPKRVEVTTELREYWVTVAKHDPERVRSMASAVLGREVGFDELYGDGDPLAKSEEEREFAFCLHVAGNGRDERLEDAGVPAQPTGELNTKRVLFMTHPINGLDDLLGIVLIGAAPYARRDNGANLQANHDEIFTFIGADELACRHADPAAAMAAYSVAFDGGKVAFANPLGMYIREPSFGAFSIGNEAVPADWIRWSRGERGLRQRLEFGPGDDDDAFLDDITVSVGASERPLVGGYQLVRELEVGPFVLTGPGQTVGDDEWKVVEPVGPIDCTKATACQQVLKLKKEFDAAKGRGGAGAPANGG